ncbi:protein RD3-like [Ruditapes philippinarum]|uniref:protein RD3-like n=1 Tax=Ruditapes philippinarum TaxID=129788 RepID=UPI00295AB96E|nr:protein RD3-like [Ruditapes philippinarum]
MFSWKTLLKPWGGGDTQRPPEKDEQMMLSDSLMLELEFHIRESERVNREREQEQRRQETGVDYSWLITTPVKSYEIPQLVRLELEEMCYQIKPSECGKVITQFRDSLLNEPSVTDMPRIMKACIQQVLDQRPKEETLTQWVTKRTVSLTNIKLRPQSKITPTDVDITDDVESQSTIDTVCSRVEQISPTSFSGRSNSLPVYHGATTRNIDHLPV